MHKFLNGSNKKPGKNWKTKQKIDAEMEKAAGWMVDQSWDAIFGEMATDGKPAGSFPFILNSNVATEDVYNFDLISIMEINSRHRDGNTEPPLYMDMHNRQGAQYTGTKFRGEKLDGNEGNLFIIHDFKNAGMIMLMENDTNKFSFTYGWEKLPDDNKLAVDSVQKIDWDTINEWEGYRNSRI